MKNIDISAKIAESASKNIKKVLNDPNLNLVSSKTREFISKTYNSTTDVIEHFLNTKAEQIPTRNIGSKLYRYENVIAYRADGRTSYNLEQNVKMLQEYGLAPKFVQYFELGENDFLTVMEVSDKNLVPYTKVVDKVPDSVKQKFINSVKSLYQNKNMVNKEIFASKDALLVTEDGKTLVYADWGNIHFLNPEDKKNMAEFMRGWHI